MGTAFVRMLVLLALMLMPFGMAAASAAIPQPAMHQMQMPSEMGHCDQQPSGKHHDQAIDCAIACAMLLEQQPALNDPGPLASLPPTWTAFRRMAGLHPGTDPPPPKLA